MKEKEIDLFDVIGLLWSKKWFIMGNVFWITLVSIIISLFLPKWYMGKSVLLPSTSGGSALSLLGDIQGMSFGQMFGGNTDQFKLLAILKSRSLKQAIVDKYDLVNKYEVENDEMAIKKFDKNFDVGIGEEMQVYIKVWDQDQELVADMTNYAVFCMDSLNIATSNKKAKEVKSFLEGRVNSIIDTLKGLEDEIALFMKENNVIELENQVISGVEQAGYMKYQIMSKEIEYSIAKINLNQNNPKLLTINKEIEILKHQYNENFNGDKNSLFPKFEDIPTIGLKLKEMERQVLYYTSILNFIGPQYEKAKLDEMKDVTTIEILDHAVRPERKDKPHRALIVIIIFGISGILSSTYVIVKHGKTYFYN